MKNPQIKPHFRVEIVEPKNVYLLSEYATHALTGSLYCQILPLLDGQHTREEIIQKLDGQVLPEHFDYVLDRLDEKGYLTDAAHSLTREAAAFWSLLNVDYAPLYIFCGQHLLAAKLRASNVDPAEGGLSELQRVIKIIRSRWKNVKIIIRGDSAYSRDDIMTWCESQTEIDYVFGLAQNPSGKRSLFHL